MNKLTFCINTSVNELSYLKLLLRSLEDNLHYKDHEILVFIDSDNENAYEWLISQKKNFSHLRILRNTLPICYGYARNINEMFKFASHEIVSYLQSDMVISQDYDLSILTHVRPNHVLCSTRIEPPLHGASPHTYTKDFGLCPQSFKYKEFLAFSKSIKSPKITSHFFAPFTLYKEAWNNIGGHDTQFRRSREDSDILKRLAINGVKFIQTWEALVYHFTCTSSRGRDWFNPLNHAAQSRALLQAAADDIEMRRFIKKWGSFHHSTEASPYYPISAYIKGRDLSLSDLLCCEALFNEVYIEEETLIAQVQEHYDTLHLPANKLLNIDSDSWGRYKYLYNQPRARDHIKPWSTRTTPISVHFNSSTNIPQLVPALSALHSQIPSLSPGLYNGGLFKLSIDTKQDSSIDKIITTNPSIKQEHLYSVS
jgi:glycosyltransferase involved in cell wall biosynthesis